MTDFKNIISHFNIKGRFLLAEPYGNGHINRTYCVYFDRGSRPPMRLILQQINTSIFHDVDGLMNNIALVTDHIRQKNACTPDVDRCTLTVIPTVDGGLYYRDEDSSCYRAYVFVENTITLEKPDNANQFESLAYAFGTFQNQLADFDASRLSEPIPDFHNTVKRFEVLENAVSADAVGRVKEVLPEIAFARARKDDSGRLLSELKAGTLPLRVTHNDTKLNNVLFDADSGKAVCVIDLDTVMPGLVHYDFGDSIRFGASTAAEDEKDLDKVEMDLGLFEAYTRGFFAACGGSLTEKEIAYLPLGAILMTFECGIRFLADYLCGDRYFRIHYPTQNLDRCRTQFKLVADMERKYSAMQTIVDCLAKN